MAKENLLCNRLLEAATYAGRHSCSLYSFVQSHMTQSQLSKVMVSEAEAFAFLKFNKLDFSGISSEHLKFASPVITQHPFFSSIYARIQ